MNFFNRTLTGRINNPWILTQASPVRLVKARRLVVKIIRANLMLNWFSENIISFKALMVIRYHCAIIVSQLNKNWFPAIKLTLTHSYIQGFPETEVACMNLSQSEELSALAWCRRYHGPLLTKKPYPFVLVCYEIPVSNKRRELKKVFDACDMPADQKAITQLSVPGDTVTTDSLAVSGKDLLSGWNTTLSLQQICRILKFQKYLNSDFTVLKPEWIKTTLQYSGSN